MRLIDSHTHINSDVYTKDFDQMLERIDAELELIINVGFDLESSIESVKLSNEYSNIYSTVGVHPHDSQIYNTLVEEKLEELSKNPKVLAIGEIGLDYYKDYSPREIQREVFIKQLKLAKKINKPIVIHCRDAYGDTVEILKDFPELKGIMHSYAGSYETAKILMDRFYFSISGPITFKNARNLKEMVEKMPIEKLLVETDSPYLTPTPFRGNRNEPIYVKYVAQEISRIKDIEYNEVVRITNENTKKAFRIGE